jgi:hypothetical protein
MRLTPTVIFGFSESAFIEEGQTCTPEWASRFIVRAALETDTPQGCYDKTDVTIQFWQNHPNDVKVEIKIRLDIDAQMALTPDPIGQHLRRMHERVQGMPHTLACKAAIHEGRKCDCGEKREAIEQGLRAWIRHWRGTPEQRAHTMPTPEVSP